MGWHFFLTAVYTLLCVVSFGSYFVALSFAFTNPQLKSYFAVSFYLPIFFFRDSIRRELYDM